MMQVFRFSRWCSWGFHSGIWYHVTE